MLTSLLLPIALASIALFFASFLSWMVVQLHKDDWKKVAKEDDLMDAVRNCDLPVGSYMFPGCANAEEMKSEAYAKKWDAGPCGILTIYPKVKMGRNLGLTFVYFLVINFCLAYLSTLGLEHSDDFRTVFRFITVTGLLTFLAAMVQHAIWFHNRIVGHIIESLVYRAIFAAMWPKA